MLGLVIVGLACLLTFGWCQNFLMNASNGDPPPIFMFLLIDVIFVAGLFFSFLANRKDDGLVRKAALSAPALLAVAACLIVGWRGLKWRSDLDAVQSALERRLTGLASSIPGLYYRTHILDGRVQTIVHRDYFVPSRDEVWQSVREVLPPDNQKTVKAVVHFSGFKAAVEGPLGGGSASETLANLVTRGIADAAENEKGILHAQPAYPVRLSLAFLPPEFFTNNNALKTSYQGFHDILLRNLKSAIPSMRILADETAEGKLKSAEATVPKDAELSSEQVRALLSRIGSTFAILAEVTENDRGGGVNVRLLFADGRIQTLAYWNPSVNPSPVRGADSPAPGRSPEQAPSRPQSN